MKDLDDFETKFNQAKEIIEKLNGELSLSDSVDLYQEGIKTLKDASNLLEKAKLVFQELEDE